MADRYIINTTADEISDKTNVKLFGESSTGTPGWTGWPTSSSVGFRNRSIYDKLDEFLSVMDFGAYGDGSHDDTLAINQCIDYVLSFHYTNRPPIFFPRGIYRITSPIVTSEDALSFVGSGNSSPFNTLSAYPGGTTILYDGPPIDSAAGGVFTLGGSLSQCRGISIRSLSIICNDLANAIWGEQTSSLRIRRVTTIQAIFGVYKIGSNNNSDTIKECIFYDPPTGGGGIEIRDTCHSMTIEDCQFENKFTGTRNPALGIRVARDGNCSDFTVKGCNFDFYRVTNAHFYLANDCKGFEFSGNYIEGRDDGVTASIMILAGGSGGVVKGNRFTAASSLGIDYGIQCYSGCESVDISGNFFEGFDVGAIRIASGARNINCGPNEIGSCPAHVVNQNATLSKNCLSVHDGDLATDTVTTDKITSSNMVIKNSGTLTIASGAITINGSNYNVDTEGGASTDDLQTINGGSDGQVLILKSANNSRVVTIKDGLGNIQCGSDFALSSTIDSIMLQYNSSLSLWIKISSSKN